MRRLYDSVTARDIPSFAQMVAGYVSGPYAWSPADWALFPNAVKVRIATEANVHDGHVLDVETGDATPAQAPEWVVARRAAGVDPTVYCSLSAWPAVRQAFAAQRVPEPHYWIAAYDNVTDIPAGAVAHQYIDPPGSGGHFDLSVVADYWPGVDAPQGDDDMLSLSFRCALVRLAYRSCLGRNPESMQMEQAWAAQIDPAGGNVDQVIDAIADSPEGQVWQARVATAAAAAPDTNTAVAAIVESDIAGLLSAAAAKASQP
jgi:hypothetical protein